jgi:integrase
MSKVISERLGHANITTTLNIYAHVTPGMQREAVAALDRILEK